MMKDLEEGCKKLQQRTIKNFNEKQLQKSQQKNHYKNNHKQLLNKNKNERSWKKKKNESSGQSLSILWFELHPKIH